MKFKPSMQPNFIKIEENPYSRIPIGSLSIKEFNEFLKVQTVALRNHYNKRREIYKEEN